MNPRSFLSFCSRLVPNGARLPILKGPLSGAKWIAGAAAGHGKGLSVLLNMSEPGQLDVARSLTTAESVCLDIGANVGLYTLLFARYGKHVFTFEPVPRNIRFLAMDLECNGIRNASIVPTAVAARSALSSFVAGNNCAVGRIYPSGEQPVVTISCDDLVQTFKVAPSILKIDVEGGELSVLEGAREVLSRFRPAILLSTHGPALRKACLEFLKDFGYRGIYPLNGPGPDTAREFALTAEGGHPALDCAMSATRATTQVQRKS